MPPDKITKKNNDRGNIKFSDLLKDPYKHFHRIQENLNSFSKQEKKQLTESIRERIWEEQDNSNGNKGLIVELETLLEEIDPKFRLNKKAFQIESGRKIFFQDYKQINPALDVANDKLHIIVPFPTEVPIIDRKGNILGHKMVVDNFVVTSSREIIECSESEFTKLNLIPRIPEMVLDQRWSMKSIESFISQSISVDPFEVFQDLRNVHDFYMDFGDNTGASTVNALYSILTYVFPIFSTIPYLRFTGTKGAAKSKEIAIHENTDFNALNAVQFSPASMFRTIQDTRGTMLIDEAETYGTKSAGGETKEALSQIVNSGFQAQGKVPRIETIGNRRVRVNFSTYSPKIIGGISEVTETLRDRSFEILLVKTLDRKKSSRSVRSTDKKWQKLRDSLYLLAMNHWNEIRDIAENSEIENRLGLIGREWDKAKPLLVIARFLERYNSSEGKKVIDELWEFLEQQREKEEELQVDSFDYSVIDSLEELVDKELQNVLPDSRNKAVVKVQLLELSMKIATLEGKDVERLNKKAYGKVIKDKILKMGLGANFKRGKGNLTYFESDQSRVRAAKERYLHANSQDVSNLSNPSNLSNFSNLSNPQDEVTENNSDSLSNLSNLLSNLSNLLSNPSETSHKTEENGNLVTEVTQVTQNKDGVLVLNCVSSR